MLVDEQFRESVILIFVDRPDPDNGTVKRVPAATAVVVRVPIGEGFFLYAPTTKHEEHDRPLSPDEIISGEWLSRADWEAASTHALELFAFGQQVAREHGLILVDTKYEFGKDAAGNILLIDEIHTPDSSRYWLAEGYEERFASGEEPDNIDKEFLRLWFAEHCDPYNDPTLPPAPDALRIELSRRYILLYELITGEAFQFPEAGQPVQERIRDSLAAYQ